MRAPTLLSAAAGAATWATTVLAVVPPVASVERTVERWPARNMRWVSTFDRHGSYSDVWGWTGEDGRRYALLGCFEGVSIVDVSHPRHPREVVFLDRAHSRWRDLKTYGRWAYDVNETGGRIAIVDLAADGGPVGVGTAGSFQTAHNLWVDVAAGRLYVAGADAGRGGVRIFGLADPAHPALLGTWDAAYAHDVYARGDRMWVSSIRHDPQPSLYIVDISDPSLPVTIGSVSGYPNAATHNAWPTDDGANVLVTDEMDGGMTRVWNVADPAHPVLRDWFFPYRAPRAIPHNVHVQGDLAFLAHYTAGLSVLDLRDLDDVREVAYWDTQPDTNAPIFRGVWGVYPHFPDAPNLVLASDIESGLWILELERDSLDRTSAPEAAGDPPRAGDSATAAPATPSPEIELGAAFPHPARAGAGVSLALRRCVPGPVLVRVHDAAGRRVRTLLDGTFPAGSTTVRWDGRDEEGRTVAAGVYFVRAFGPAGAIVRRVTILR